MPELATEDSARSDASDLPRELERYRKELTAYCYRMLGSAFDAEDAVQETLVRAWRGFERFEGRSAVRSWLYRIATNVCLTMLEGRHRRARPMDLSPAATTATAQLGPPLPETTWVGPIPDDRVLDTSADPADLAVARESIRLAFVAVLQHLPPRQRAVLILREVLQWSAAEVAALLETSVASVNSALQRARATLARHDPGPAADPLAPEHRELVGRYAEVFERYDIEALVELLHEDATICMPPYNLWLRGPEEIAAWHLGPGIECRGSRLLPVMASGLPGFGQYRPSGPGGRHEPWALQVLEIRDGKIIGLNAFLDTAALFPLFNLPPVLEGK